MSAAPRSERQASGPDGSTSSDLSPLDLAFARAMMRLHDEPGQPHAALVYHSALLVSAERAHGNSCVELTAWAGQPSPDTTQPFVFPAATEWAGQLLASGRCAAPDAVGARPLVLDGHRLYLRRFFLAEQRLAAAIRSRITQHETVDLTASSALFRRLFPNASRAADWQAVAAAAALRSNLVFITGGPGTGKTTVAAKLLALLLHRTPNLDIAVAAPTGRAAAHLAEAIGGAVQREQLGAIVGHHLPSAGSTLHRLLGYQPWSERFRYRAGHQLPHDVIVIDEASMVDVLMMDALFAAARDSARIIVLGDADQLASVDTGFVLGDVARAAMVAGGSTPGRHSRSLANAYAQLAGADAALLEPEDATQSGVGPLRDAVVRLRVSYRFGAQPGIGALAAATQAGKASEALDVLRDPRYPDVTVHPMASIGSLLAPIERYIDTYLAADTPRAALDALATFRLLCAMRDGDTGVSGLNDAIEHWLRVRGRSTGGWYDHRPILITANDTATHLFNGDVGTTLAVDGVPMVHFPVPGGGVRSFTPVRLPAHETAWAMTVHKSQGSEFNHVVLVLPEKDTRGLTRELLYTGLTRAKASVTVIGSSEMIRRAISRSVARSSGLVKRLTALP